MAEPRYTVEIFSPRSDLKCLEFNGMRELDLAEPTDHGECLGDGLGGFCWVDGKYIHLIIGAESYHFSLANVGVKVTREGE